MVKIVQKMVNVVFECPLTAKDPELGHATAIHQEPQFGVLKNFPQTLLTHRVTYILVAKQVTV